MPFFYQQILKTERFFYGNDTGERFGVCGLGFVVVKTLRHEHTTSNIKPQTSNIDKKIILLN
jgi:hypothetical protein